MSTISVGQVGKAYKQYPTRWSRLLEWFAPFGRERHSLRWILRDISFVVEPGEAVGIVGVNGAGKSTLLKMITGTTMPTTGSISVTGRVSALLELGMGFHPDFTGRQNVLMAGQLLGMDTGEVMTLMPEIEAFAEIGDYIDQPVRMYSSGMQMRLAFSVATARRPDVLIVDEALSVGDAYFQHKSFDRIRSFREEGTTLLMVSHDRTAIQSICDRAILLDSGRLVKIGKPEEVMDFYNALLAERESYAITQRVLECGTVQTVSGTGEAVVSRIELLDKLGRPVETIDVGTTVTLRVEVVTHAPIPTLVLGYMIKDRLGQPIYGTNTQLKEHIVSNVESGKRVLYRFEFPANLGEGHYSIATSVASSENHLQNNYEWKDRALMFSVVNASHPHFIGCAWLDPFVTVEY
ncbi:Vitamin B12 import ATP-binding protein BtuD [Cupriavidus laharis]|uniref:Vitamin B12 import ATP-binding protein BtuD n=1 Tax=Cupriavidus laharis TaxID=151654 RepID=A0ABN7YQ55_9BURK|nr:ABC transporter ATP-binding protein [Cupriavidus laharis]CAG9175584.1 Vitamin B12 import ATP-binding protein BtuD [Cupriavidus laharis]